MSTLFNTIIGIVKKSFVKHIYSNIIIKTTEEGTKNLSCSVKFLIAMEQYFRLIGFQKRVDN